MSGSGRRMACVQVDADWLAKALGFPEGTRIVAMAEDLARYRPGVFTFVVEHPDLREVADYEMLPTLLPEFTQDVVAVTKFKSWGQT